jgi:hypothetical protein
MKGEPPGPLRVSWPLAGGLAVVSEPAEIEVVEAEVGVWWRARELAATRSQRGRATMGCRRAAMRHQRLGPGPERRRDSGSNYRH